jgi:hypothetical protein
MVYETDVGAWVRFTEAHAALDYARLESYRAGLADRVDDLTEAIDLLKLVLWPYEESERIKQIHARSDALLARYQED